MTLFEWIEESGGVAQTAKIMKESPRTVASWYYSEKIPKPQAAVRLIRASRGALDFNRIYAPLFAELASREAKRLTR
ncbi:hypothetical protein [Aeromonas aquatica]|uniref:hypothetical protein n=1 Tax=Aeromonas aquatica TaxID=558964 RepID=UPI00051C88DC|nr:hypothetical protein [Aeromonas aquatica]